MTREHRHDESADHDLTRLWRARFCIPAAAPPAPAVLVLLDAAVAVVVVLRLFFGEDGDFGGADFDAADAAAGFFAFLAEGAPEGAAASGRFRAASAPTPPSSSSAAAAAAAELLAERAVSAPPSAAPAELCPTPVARPCSLAVISSIAATTLYPCSRSRPAGRGAQERCGTSRG